jgi:2-phospho-L-lactate guanylyltransferase
MDVRAIIPVKSLAASKGRLAHLLSQEQRVQLMQVLLQHVLTVVEEAPAIAQTVVISGDSQVRRIAEGYGAQVLAEPMPADLNSAVTIAADQAARQGARAILVMPADLPFVSVSDIELMVAAGREDWDENGSTGYVTAQEFVPSLHHRAAARPLVAICGDRHDQGTNGLLLRPVADFTFRYGPHSLQLHIAEALARDYQLRLVNAPGLRFDLDTEADWRRFHGDERGASIKQSLASPLTN